MQQGLGISIRLFQPLEHQIAGSLECQAVRKIVAHRTVSRIDGVLFVNNDGHTFESLPHLLFIRDAVQQPVGDVLARNSQCCPVFHDPNVIDVRHFRTTNTVIDPAYDVTQNALRVVVEIGLDKVG